MTSRRPSTGALMGMLALLICGVAVVVGPSLFLGWVKSLNPFDEETIDRTGPSVLTALNDISEYHPASGHYETVVDLERDTNNLPDWISGERLLYVAKGDVDAVVDFGDLDEQRVTVSEDGTTVTISLPQPSIGEPVLDLENSYVADHDQGVAQKFKGSDLEREAQLTALEQMTAAASGEGMLIDRAKDNTTAMLRGLLRSLGYTSVTITFDD